MEKVYVVIEEFQDSTSDDVAAFKDKDEAIEFMDVYNGCMLTKCVRMESRDIGGI